MSASSQSPAPGLSGESSNRRETISRLPVRGKGKAPGRAPKRRELADGTPRDADEETDEQYDPDQPVEERRQIQRGFRELIRDLNDNNEEYLQPNSEGLHETIRRANELSVGVKQTTEATIDARVLVSAADASYRKTVRLTSGNVAQGVDVDEFVSKCIGYMRMGRGIDEDDAPDLFLTQQQRRSPQRPSRPGPSLDDEEDDEYGDEGDPLNWEHLGRFAAIPHVRRPATTGFLLGPMSVVKKARKVMKRSAPLRLGNMTETRPQVLNAEDIQKNEKNDLFGVCNAILKRLTAVSATAQDDAEAAFERGDQEETRRIMNKWGLRENGGIDFFKFVINPKSFGQTVENMFYVSFLIRDGKIEITYDDHDRPTLFARDSTDVQTNDAGQGSQKHQAVFHLDMATWRDLIDAFDITSSLIEHRKEESTRGPGARGWYS